MTDEKLPISPDKRALKSWLRGRSIHTEKAYRQDMESFLSAAGKTLSEITIEDVQEWYASLDGAEASKRRKLAAVKSCMKFCVENRFIDHNPAAAVRPAKVQEDLHERILSREDVMRMIDLEKDPRRHAVLRTLYIMGLRNSELTGMRWKDLTRRKQGAAVSIFGKGGKTRHVQATASLLKEWEDLREGRDPEAPVLCASVGGPLTHDAVGRIVTRAAKRAGIAAKVTPHWLRHACASHALDRGANVHVVQATLGHASLSTTTRYAHVQEGDGAGSWLED